MSAALTNYVLSEDYGSDLEATIAIWSSINMLGTAGLFIFLSYITIPLLLKVQPANGHNRVVTMPSGLDDERERMFLCRLLGLDSTPPWAGGIRNPRVQEMIAGLGRQHNGFSAMNSSYMNYFAAIIALSALEVHAAYNSGLQEACTIAYWRYMQHAMRVMGCELGEITAARNACIQFCAEHSAPSAAGVTLLDGLNRRYPAYVKRAWPTLYRSTQQVMNQLREPGTQQLLLEAHQWTF